jgi:predicted AlkP superfamily pyrophosphatase or phosphodiesterase
MIFFVDGLDQARLEQMIRDDECPHIRRYFVDGGVRVDHAVTSMPAVTYSNSTSLITGCFPGHHGILGNKWFDRRTLEYHDYGYAWSYRAVNDHFTPATLFEILRDQFTISVQAHTQRGASQGIDWEALAAVDWYTQQYSNVDARVGYGIDEAFTLAEQQGRWPAVMLYYFPGVDEVGHQYGSDSLQYAEAVQVVDTAIGRICRSVQGTPLRDSTYFVLMSDHGHVATPLGGTFPLRRYLESALNTTVRDGGTAADGFDLRGDDQADCGIVLVDSSSTQRHRTCRPWPRSCGARVRIASECARARAGWSSSAACSTASSSTD